LLFSDYALLTAWVLRVFDFEVKLAENSTIEMKFTQTFVFT